MYVYKYPKEANQGCFIDTTLDICKILNKNLFKFFSPKCCPDFLNLRELKNKNGLFTILHVKNRMYNICKLENSFQEMWYFCSAN